MTPEEKYNELIAQGASHNMAEILAYRAAPGLDTGSLRANGDYGTNSPTLRAALKANGADPNGVYHTGLAKYLGDPRAVCRDKTDAAKRAKELSYDGPPAWVDVCPKIVAEKTAQVIAADPSKGGTPKKVRETAEAVKHRLKGNHA